MRILKIGLFMLAAGITACTEMDNTNPNVPSTVNPGIILPQVIYNTSNTLVGNAFELNNELIQYTCMNNTFTEVQRFKLLPSNSNGLWGLYSRMRDLNDIIVAGEKTAGLENYKAIAIIIQTYIFSVLTDTYGDIPFSEAGLGATGNVYMPKYDKQEDIYVQMLERLKQAAETLKTSSPLLYGGDPVYNGNLARWQKFANSLRLRLLMRVSAKLPAAVTEIQTLLSDPQQYPVMESNDDNFVYRYSGSLPDANALSLNYVRDFDFKYKSVSAFIVDSLKKFNDSRLFQFARPTNASANTANPQYVGLPNALPVTESANYNGGYNFQSYLGTRFQSNTEPAIWMTFSELLFLKTEAAQKGYYNGQPKDLYEAAIKASFAYWGAPFTESYLTQQGVVYDGSLSKIYLQKFYALFFTGMEAWNEYRRTGYPVLVPGPTNVNDGKIPNRIPYPLSEQSLNRTNYTDAAARMGNDNMNHRMWWQP
ncbi:SusD/RagB family nutrient-binding outer membrane lipoprotein [uncultured Chitinophaga sp.]|uniref:SusD/RagB family nutrient-binding outer membrane lipoprotein n=1 Tax=uncultured Chitinophaga sp. TaxID=339340 RepID=UPI0025FC6B39|nr:SusD/RagB family nutrient-binding outer membrane lipoprotein [uncultured Chitinophaga sp.]